MVYATDLKSVAERHEGSIPSLGTKKINRVSLLIFLVFMQWWFEWDLNYYATLGFK